MMVARKGNSRVMPGYSCKAQPSLDAIAENVFASPVQNGRMPSSRSLAVPTGASRQHGSEILFQLLSGIRDLSALAIPSPRSYFRNTHHFSSPFKRTSVSPISDANFL
jgi:hypothetical protein